MGALGSRGHEGSVKESVNSEGELPEPSAAPVTSWLGSPSIASLRLSFPIRERGVLAQDPPRGAVATMTRGAAGRTRSVNGRFYVVTTTVTAAPCAGGSA